MSTTELYETEGFEGTMDPTSESRKFQVSIVISQDKDKSGILSFLQQIEESSVGLPTSTPAQTVRPSSGTEDYNA